MAEEPDNLVLVILRRIEDRLGRLEEKVDRLIQDGHDQSIRLANVEENQAGLQRRMDRFDVRMDRIERRLELVDSSYGGVRE